MQKKDIEILTTVTLDVPLIAEWPRGKITLFTCFGLENKFLKTGYLPYTLHIY